MADQKHSTVRASTPEGNECALPTPATSGRHGSRTKQLPTVTPRRFKKFFTPRSSLRRDVNVSASRQALRDITGGGSNSRSLGRRRPSKVDEIQIFEDENDGSRDSSRKRRRLLPHTPDATPELSSPLNRCRGLSLDSERTTSDAEDDLPSSQFSSYHGIHADEIANIRPIGRWRQHGLSGQRLQQELGGLSRRRGRIQMDCGSDWQHETASFYTRPDDSNACVNITGTEPNFAIPFCTASCNTNSLVAVGDEEGGVRLLETDTKSQPNFSKAYLTFQAHGNAVLDLAFSPNDLLLATASGDQTSRIIDMPTQTATFTMAGHTSSVKQVCFQPGSSSVVATSSRDGGVLIWDLRCKGHEGPVRDIRVSLSGPDDIEAPNASEHYASFVNSIQEAHAPTPRQTAEAVTKQPPKPSLVRDCPSRTEPQSRRGDVSITALAFLPAGREHLLLSGSEANASVKLWDLRTTHSHRRFRATPLSSTRLPESHNSHRHFGLTSMALSGDGSRLYTVCRDNTVYAYSTPHLILGHAPELSLTASRPRRPGGTEKEGLGPMYGFRHPQFHATTFYVKSSLRAAAADKPELLAVGSSDGCAVLFPTDERYLGQAPRSRPALARTNSGASLFTRLNDTIPIYQHGTPLVRGHSREVTDMTWTYGGELVTVGDDLTARCWREGADARDLRVGGETEGRRWGCGWAEVVGDWDGDE